MRNQKGITLIALIITIIVLLILAGVSISLVVGDNGVLTQASEAAVKTRESKAEEELKMAWDSIESEYWQAWGEDTTLQKDTLRLDKDEWNKYLSETGSVVEDPTVKDGVYTIKYKSNDQEMTYTFTIDDSEAVALAGSTVTTPGATFSKYLTNPGCHSDHNDHTNDCYTIEENTLTWEELKLAENGAKYGYRAAAIADNGVASKGFGGCDCLTSIVLPDSTTCTSVYGFSYCKSLTSVTLPNGVIEIKNFSFNGCTSLANINIPDSVTRIGAAAFYDCTSLANVIIPNSVTDIGGSAFFNTAWLGIKQSENPLVIVNNIVINGEKCTGEIVIPEGVVSIASESFFESPYSDVTPIVSITIPSSVKDIGSKAFACCKSSPIIYYNGSMADWNSITKDENWCHYKNHVACIDVIHCSDGDITI